MTTFRSRTIRILAATALTVGLAGTGTAAFASTPAHNPAPGNIALPQPGPVDPHGPGDIAIPDPGPTPPQGPGDLTNGEPEPECPPQLASCDLAPNPGNPGDGTPDDGSNGTPDDGSDGGSNGGQAGTPGSGAEVDAPVAAHPTFTG